MADTLYYKPNELLPGYSPEIDGVPLVSTEDNLNTGEYMMDFDKIAIIEKSPDAPSAYVVSVYDNISGDGLDESDPEGKKKRLPKEYLSGVLSKNQVDAYIRHFHMAEATDHIQNEWVEEIEKLHKNAYVKKKEVYYDNKPCLANPLDENHPYHIHPRNLPDVTSVIPENIILADHEFDTVKCDGTYACCFNHLLMVEKTGKDINGIDEYAFAEYGNVAGGLEVNEKPKDVLTTGMMKEPELRKKLIEGNYATPSIKIRKDIEEQYHEDLTREIEQYKFSHYINNNKNLNP